MIWISRTHERVRFIAPVEVSWVNRAGKECSAKGNTVNISPLGMQVEVNAPIHLLAAVRVRVAGKEVMSKASVRHCRQVCSWFRLGLEFEQTLLSEGIPDLTEVLRNL